MKKRANYINPDMIILNETRPRGTKEDPFICYCGKCGGTFACETSSINSGYYHKLQNPDKVDWCPVCDRRIIIKGINDVGSEHPELIKYFANEEDAYKYASMSNQYVKLKCPDCKTERTMQICSLVADGFNCKMCSDNLSYPNKVCRALLKMLPVENSEPEYIRPWTQGRKYDGYFKYKNENYLLEFDGKQHFVDTSWSTKEDQEKNDLLKDKLAKDNNYILIRINCFDSSYENIKNKIYESKLADIFDLDLLDWNKIHELSMTNLFIDVINYYKTHETNAVEIAEIFNITRHTASDYLHRANKMKLINYTSKTFTERSRRIIHENHKNKMICSFHAYSPNNEYLGEFFTYADCVNKLKECYPDQSFQDVHISNSLKSGKPYKGFIFNYSDNKKHKANNYELTVKICNYFLNNQNQDNKEIAKVLNLSECTVRNHLQIGINIGLININELHSVAFAHGRFKKYKQERKVV